MVKNRVTISSGSQLARSRPGRILDTTIAFWHDYSLTGPYNWY